MLQAIIQLEKNQLYEQKSLQQMTTKKIKYTTRSSVFNGPKQNVIRKDVIYGTLTHFERCAPYTLCTCKSHLKTFMLYPSSSALVEGPLFENAFEMPTLWSAISNYASEINQLYEQKRLHQMTNSISLLLPSKQCI